MGEAALLWSAGDMEAQQDGKYKYMPTQVFNVVADVEMLPALACRHVQMMSVHSNTAVGNIYLSPWIGLVGTWDTSSMRAMGHPM